MMDIGDNIMFSTDYPHWSYDAPDWAIRRFPADQRERIMRGNAHRAVRAAVDGQGAQESDFGVKSCAQRRKSRRNHWCGGAPLDLEDTIGARAEGPRVIACSLISGRSTDGSRVSNHATASATSAARIAHISNGTSCSISVSTGQG